MARPIAAMYFAGDGIASLTLEDRMTLTNMAIEAGGKNGVCDVDEKTLKYVRAPQQHAAPGTSTRRRRAPSIISRPIGIWPRWSRWLPSRTARTTATPPTTAAHVKLDQAYIGSLHRRQNHRHDLRRQHPQGPAA